LFVIFFFSSIKSFQKSIFNVFNYFDLSLSEKFKADMKQSFGEITNRHIFQQGLRDLIKEELHKHDELENLYVEWEKGMAVAYKGSVCVTGVDE